jgi:hypothetical protein
VNAGQEAEEAWLIRWRSDHLSAPLHESGAAWGACVFLRVVPQCHHTTRFQEPDSKCWDHFRNAAGRRVL